MSSRIEQIIEEIEEYIDGCRFQPLSTTKIVVNKEELEELLRELRLKTPDEIKRYQKIIANKDAILADAQAKADEIIREAQEKAQAMINEHEVTQQAYAQANETINKSNQQAQTILDSATSDANNIRYSALSYTDDMLGRISALLENALNDAVPKYRSLSESLQNALAVVNSNRAELAAPAEPVAHETPETDDPVPAASDATDAEDEDDI